VHTNRYTTFFRKRIFSEIAMFSISENYTFRKCK
jgi:hypothetical protein